MMNLKKNLKIFTLSFVLALVCLMNVNAEEKDVFTVCKTGCDYDSLLAAKGQSAVKGKTVKLMEDMVIDTKTAIAIRPDMTLDLGGHTLTVADGTLLGVYENDIVITNGTLSLKGSSMLVAQSNSEKSDVKTHLTIDKSLTINAEDIALAVMPGADSFSLYGITVDIKGKVNAKNFAIILHGDQKAIDPLAPVINIYDGAELKSEEDTALYGAGYGFWNIYGGLIEGTEALSIKSGEYNIKGGTFNAFGKYVKNPVAHSNGSEPTGAAISITATEGYEKRVKLNITDGNFNSKNGHALFEGLTNSTKTAVQNIEIKGGTFTSKEVAVRVDSAKTLGSFITGGTYSSDVKDYVKELYTSSLKDGKYLVEENKKVETDNKDVSFESKNPFSNTYKLVVDLIEETKEEQGLVEKFYAKNTKIKEATLLALYDINVMDGNNVVRMENGEFTISIAIDKKLQNYDSYKVVYVGDELEEIDAKLVDGKIVFTTSHLSTYGIVGVNNAEVKNPNTGDSVTLFIIFGTLSLMLAFGFMYKYKKIINR